MSNAFLAYFPPPSIPVPKNKARNFKKKTLRPARNEKQSACSPSQNCCARGRKAWAFPHNNAATKRKYRGRTISPKAMDVCIGWNSPRYDASTEVWNPQKGNRGTSFVTNMTTFFLVKRFFLVLCYHVCNKKWTKRINNAAASIQVMDNHNKWNSFCRHEINSWYWHNVQQRVYRHWKSTLREKKYHDALSIIGCAAMRAIRYMRTKKRRRAADLLILSMKQSQFDVVKVTRRKETLKLCFYLLLEFPSFGS